MKATFPLFSTFFPRSFCPQLLPESFCQFAPCSQLKIMKHPHCRFPFPGVFILLLLRLLCFLVVIDAQSSFYQCPSSGQNYTANSNFDKNLRRLLESLKTNASRTGFFNLTEGQTPDEAYGLVQCRRDTSAFECNTCATSAATQILQDCPNKRIAVEWFDGCILRYSSADFFGIDDGVPGKMAYTNTEFMSNPSPFKPFVFSMFNNLTVSATAGTSSLLYATGSFSYSDNVTVYGLTECTRDLRTTSCYACLKSSTTVMSECCSDRKGARILSGSCVIRYEVYPFFGNLPAPAPPPASSPAPPQSNPLSPTSNFSNVNERPGRKSSRIALIVTLPVSATALLLLCFLLVCLCRRKKREDKQPGDSTDNFSPENKVGEGGYGPVYKGKLPDGQEIAVKRLSRHSGQGVSEFKNEVQLVAKLQHRNLVKLLGCCFEEGEKILIYEYLFNKSLDHFIFGDAKKRQQLDWFTRFKIIQGIARGLLYLHEDSRVKIIHRDLKASNILLDGDMNAKITDFGLAKLFGLEQTQGNTSRIAGTFGYMAPEYATQGMISVKSDVFSYGVILLEIISGEKNYAFYQTDLNQDLVGYAWKLWSQDRAIELVDQMMPGPPQRNEIMRCIHIGLLCVQEAAVDRPTMSQVALMFGSGSMTLALPSPPAFSGGRSKIQSESSETYSEKTQSLNEVTITGLHFR